MKPCPKCNLSLPNDTEVCVGCGWRPPPSAAPHPIVVDEPLKTSRILFRHLGVESGLILAGGVVGAWFFGVPGFFLGCLAVFVLVITVTLTFS